MRESRKGCFSERRHAKIRTSESEFDRTGAGEKRKKEGLKRADYINVRDKEHTPNQPTPNQNLPPEPAEKRGTAG